MFCRLQQRCKRLHFFSTKFTQNEFQKNLNEGDPKTNTEFKKIINSYLGFIVLKPLPQSKIGRTCLKVFSDPAIPRHYTTTKTYQINLFGIDLSIESIAFQQQDQEVAACATTAIWVASQKTAEIFNSQLFSPSEITSLAINSDHESRIFPASGLNIREICQAFRKIGLEIELLEVENLDLLEMKSFIYAYLKYGIPIVLGFYIPNLGRHAVTITGYCFNNKINGPFMSDNIDKIYVHDDNIGPFARYTLTTTVIDKKTIPAIEVSHYSSFGTCPVISMIAPVYHKIRVPLTSVKIEKISALDKFFESILNLPGIKLSLDYKEFVWDVFLTDVKKVKKHILEDGNFSGIKEDILTTSFPRYLWEGSLYVNNNKILTLLFDATDLRQNNFNLHSIYIYDQKIKDLLKLLLPYKAIINNPFIQKLIIELEEYFKIPSNKIWRNQNENLHIFSLN